MRSRSGFVVALIAFLIGLFIGLVVLGWWLWPVKWEGLTLQDLDPIIQEQYLRAAIDSFAYRANEPLAALRYKAVGSAGETLLNQIYAQPGDLNPGDIERFALAVGAQLTKAPLPTFPPPTPPPSLPAIPFLANLRLNLVLYVCGALMGLVLLFGAAFALLRLRKRKAVAPSKNKEESLESPKAPRESQLVVPSALSESLAEEELPSWLEEEQPQVYEPIPQEEEATASFPTGPVTGIIDEDQLPSFLREIIRPEEEPEMLASSLVEGEPSSPEEEQATRILPEEVKPTSEGITPIATQKPQQETFAKFSQDIRLLERIPSAQAERLYQAGLISPLLLLRKGATPEGRKQIAQATGLSDDLIAAWVHYIDLFRVHGIAQEQADLLYLLGIRSLADLAQADPLVLSQQATQATEHPPDIEQFSNWVSQAQKLPRAVQD